MVGSSIGPYEVIERLGAGGMGEVYLARDVRLNRHVALKSLSDPALDIPEARARLLQEARAAARLTHPNIAAIHDIVDCDPRPCIVMEYVQGETLAAALARGPMPPAQSVSIGIQLADALAHAHAAGVIHRDLKPANVMLTSDGTAKILDFGVARIHELAPDETTTRSGADIARLDAGKVAGTPAYMAPEQLTGGAASSRTDVYSLGALLFELLTGHRAFPSRDFSGLALAILGGPMPRACDDSPAVPEELSAVVERAMAREPRDRYQSALELKSALQRAARALLEQPTMVVASGAKADATRTKQTAQRDTRGATRRRWLAGWRLAASVVVTLGVCALVVWLTTFRPRAESPVVAVLPLANAIGDASKDYVGVGISESLTSALTGVPAVTVVSRNETVKYVGGRQDIARIARDLGATFIVAGSVQQSGARLRFAVKLQKPDGRVLWSREYEGGSDELFARQQAAAGDLVDALGVTLTPSQRQRVNQPLTKNRDALDDYAIGRALLARFDVQGNIERAATAFERAIARDPNFVAAHAGLGEAYLLRYRNDKDPAWIPQAVTSVLRALEIDPADPNAHMTLASIYLDTGKYEQAITELRRVISSQPNNDEAHRLLAGVRAKQGRSDEAVQEYRQAIAIRPEYFRNHIVLGNMLLASGRYAEAKPEYERAIECQPDSPWGFLNLGVIYLQDGDYGQAIAYSQRALNVDPNQDFAYSNMGTAYYALRQYGDAVRAFEQAVKLKPRNPASRRNLGDGYLRLGDRERARAEYQMAADLTDDLLKVNPQDALALASHALYSAKAGQTDEAVRDATRAVELAAKNPEVLYKRAVVHALAGQMDEAARWLQQAIAAGYSRRFAREDDDLAAIRKLPQVDALLKETR